MMLSITMILFLPARINLILFPLLASSSAITCLQLPQGVTGSAVNPSSVNAATAIATGLSSGKFDNEADMALLSAQIPEGNAAFSTFVPLTVFPFSSLSAAPTLNPEYGAYACTAASIADSISLLSSVSSSSLLSYSRHEIVIFRVLAMC